MAEEVATDVNAPFRDYAIQGELRFPRCIACRRFHWYPMRLCPNCGSGAVEWQRVDPRGTLFTWTVVRHAFDAAFAVPYVVALVEFAEAPGVRLVAYMPGEGPGLQIGDPVEVVLEPGEKGVRATMRPVGGGRA